MPKPADAALPTRQDLDPSPALSIVENGPKRFEGRKLGILVSDGSDAGLLKALKGALEKAGAIYEIIAPRVTGVKASDGSWIDADQMIDGGPSVLYDAVALLPAAAAIDDLLQESAARDLDGEGSAIERSAENLQQASSGNGRPGKAAQSGFQNYRQASARKDVCRHQRHH
jgi:catalase